MQKQCYGFLSRHNWQFLYIPIKHSNMMGMLNIRYLLEISVGYYLSTGTTLFKQREISHCPAAVIHP